MDESQFYARYASFPDPLLFQTPAGTWLTNSAADALCLSRSDFEQLTAWDGSSSIWLAGQFFYIHGHRTAEGLFLLLSTDSFLSSAAVNLSSQLRQKLSLAFNGISALKEYFPSGDVSASKEWSDVNRALFQIFRMVTELDCCTAGEGSCHKVFLDLTQWLRSLSSELRHWCLSDGRVTLRLELPFAPLPIMADPALLDCMVSHLVSNAIKSVEPSEKAEIGLSLKKAAGQAVLTISGNAAAFSPAVLNDPLWNQPARLLPRRGLGLGLPIAQRVAALHGGTLMATHTADSSQLVFSLPLSVPDGYLASPVPRPEPIDDFSLVRVILSDALSSDSFRPDYPSYHGLR